MAKKKIWKLMLHYSITFVHHDAVTKDSHKSTPCTNEQQMGGMNEEPVNCRFYSSRLIMHDYYPKHKLLFSLHLYRRLLSVAEAAFA